MLSASVIVPVVIDPRESVDLSTVGEVDGVCVEIAVTEGDGITAEVEGTVLPVIVTPCFKSSRSDCSKR